MANVPVETNMTSEIDKVYRKADTGFKSPLATLIQSSLAAIAQENETAEKKISKQAGIFAPLEME
jgi:hypothetical protein